LINEEGEDNRKEIAGLLYPEVDKQALTRQIFELVKYGKFTWTDVMNMPITSRRRYHFLLGRYNDREIAAAQKKPLPPIEVEDQVSSLNQMADKVRGEGGESKLSESGLPASVRAALKQIEKAAKPKIVSKKDKDEAKKKMIIRRKEDIKTESVLEEKEEEKTEEKSGDKSEEKPITLEVINEPEEKSEDKAENKKEDETPKKEDSPSTLKEASDKLKAKYSKIGIPNELKVLLSKKRL
jgi:hypothetical protein